MPKKMCCNHFILPDTFAKTLFGCFKFTRFFFLINIVDLSDFFDIHTVVAMICLSVKLLTYFPITDGTNLVIYSFKKPEAIASSVLIQRNPMLISLGLSSPRPFLSSEFSKRDLQFNNQNAKSVGFSFNRFIYPTPLTKCVLCILS